MGLKKIWSGMTVFDKVGLIAGIACLIMGLALTQCAIAERRYFEVGPREVSYVRLQLNPGDKVVFPPETNGKLMGIMPRYTWDVLQILGKTGDQSLRSQSSNATNNVVIYSGASFMVESGNQYVVWGENMNDTGQTFDFSINRKSYETMGWNLVYLGAGGILFGVIPALPKSAAEAAITDSRGTRRA